MALIKRNHFGCFIRNCKDVVNAAVKGVIPPF